MCSCFYGHNYGRFRFVVRYGYTNNKSHLQHDRFGLINSISEIVSTIFELVPSLSLSLISLRFGIRNNTISYQRWQEIDQDDGAQFYWE